MNIMDYDDFNIYNSDLNIKDDIRKFAIEQVANGLEENEILEALEKKFKMKKDEIDKILDENFEGK
jgi:hypothetical protein